MKIREVGQRALSLFLLLPLGRITATTPTGTFEKGFIARKLSLNPNISFRGSGGSFMCVKNHRGQVKCWGKNKFGQLGLGHTKNIDTVAEMGDNLPYTNLGTGKVVSVLSTGFSHSCAVFTDTSVKCWDGFYSFGNICVFL
ncbi:hypothetical protein AAMO2058_001681900 [Amorphochlora amoebiformis]